MTKTIIAIAAFLALIACTDAKTVQKNHLLQNRVQQKDKFVEQLNADLKLKNREVDRLKEEVANRDGQIQRLMILNRMERANSDDLAAQVKTLTDINSQQKQQIETQLAEIKAINDSLRQAKSDRDFWNDKFHTTIHNTAQLIQMKDGIIKRQKRDIEEQNEQMVRIIQQRDVARAQGRMIIHELPR